MRSMKLSALLVFVFVAAGAWAQAPDLPYQHYITQYRRVFTNNGSAFLPPVEGFGAVDMNAEVVCIFDEWINGTTYKVDISANYSAKVVQRRVINDYGVFSNCTSVKIPDGNWSEGQTAFAPSEADRKQMKLAGHTIIRGTKCSVYTLTRNASSGIAVIINWTIEADTHVPRLYVMQELTARGWVTMTMEYFTFADRALPDRCRKPLTCGSDVCIARPEASHDALQGALSWTCGQIDCSPIGPKGALWYPNTIEAHATWAFEHYYDKFKAVDHSHACYFNGVGELNVCQVNTTCVARESASDEAMLAALKWLCSPQGLQDCAPIQPGGEFFHPNTTRNHATWAYNAYYQPYKCVPNWDACDFGGTARVVAV